jgi:hypothetical protein
MNLRPLTFVAAIALVALALAAAPVLVVSLAHGNLNALAFGAVVVLFALGCLAGTAAWIAGLIAAAGLRRWDWFVAVLLLGAPATLALDITRSRAIGDAGRS